MARRERYLIERDTAHGTVLYRNMDTNELLDEELIRDVYETDVEEMVIDKVMTDCVIAHLAELEDDEKELLKLMYFSESGERVTQRKAAQVLGISQPMVKKRHDKAISHLKEILKI